MSPLTTPGDVTGLVLLAAAIVTTVSRVASRAAARHPGELPKAQPHVPAPAVPIWTVPVQATWQARVGQAPVLVEDRIPGPAPLQLEEAIGTRDQ